MRTALPSMLAARWRLSPNFVPLAAVFLVTGVLLFTGTLYSRVGVFLFVTAGWIVTLCLHEAAHALAAWHGGDRSVLGKGYLSLDPLVYAHVELSFIMPILFLILGGIGLPGGAVYINRAVMRSRAWDAFVSLAGPLANLACFAVLAIPFVLGLDARMGTSMFWCAMAFLAALQASAALFSLIPIPGLDGFGVLRPYLPYAVQERAQSLGAALSLILLLLFLSPQFSRVFWGTIMAVCDTAGIAPMEVGYGSYLFRFWQ